MAIVRKAAGWGAIPTLISRTTDKAMTSATETGISCSGFRVSRQRRSDRNKSSAGKIPLIS